LLGVDPRTDVCCRILLIKRRHLGSRYMGDGAARAHARSRVCSGGHGDNNKFRPGQVPEAGRTGER
jgi:hypothetical protein